MAWGPVASVSGGNLEMHFLGLYSSPAESEMVFNKPSKCLWSRVEFEKHYSRKMCFKANTYQLLSYSKFLIKSPFFLGRKIKHLYAWGLSLYSSGLLFSFHFSSLVQKKPYTPVIMNSVLLFCVKCFLASVLLYHRSLGTSSSLYPQKLPQSMANKC